jgi:hypothetical protein
MAIHRRGWRQDVAWSRWTIAALLLAGALAVAAAQGSARPQAVADPPVAIEVKAEPIGAFEIRDATRRQFGLLEFRGGLVLKSSYKHFGGLSAIRVEPDGARFLALTDKSWWLRGRIAYDGTRPAGMTSTEMAPMLGPDGRPLAARGWYDTEAMTADGGTIYAGIERVHQIVRFNYGKDGLLARGHPIAVPSQMRTLPRNRGIEALVFVPKGLALGGTLVAISERGLDQAGNILGFLIGGRTPGPFTVKRGPDFDISDAALLPSGDLLLLERRFGWNIGLAIRLRRIPLAQIKPDALVDGAILLEADLGYEIDNMEGLSIHRSASGETVLTLVSDDNFSVLQRTLLLQFTLAEP